MTDLLGKSLYDLWQSLCSAIDERYDMEISWNSGGKNQTYEYKYRRGGKTLCSLYTRENCLAFNTAYELHKTYMLFKVLQAGLKKHPDKYWDPI